MDKIMIAATVTSAVAATMTICPGICPLQFL